MTTTFNPFNPDFFVERRGTRKYKITDFDDASSSAPLWLTNKEKQIFENYCMDTSIQITPYSESSLSKEWVMQFWQEAVDFDTQTED